MKAKPVQLTHTYTHTDLLQYHNEPWSWRQLVFYDYVDREHSKNAGLYGGQDQARPQRQAQLGAGAVVQGTPEHQGVVGDEQRVDKHHTPGLDDRTQFPKGKEEQVKLQDQPKNKQKQRSDELCWVEARNYNSRRFLT